MFKRIFTMMLVLVLCINNVTAVFADSSRKDTVKTEDEVHESVISILEEYKREKNMQEKRNLASSADELLDETVEKLSETGSEVFLVNSNNYSEVENFLNTDLEEMGLDKSASYMIIASGDENSNQRGTAGSSFSYTYGGKTYTMRYLTVVYGDGESSNDYYHQDDINLLDNPTLETVTSLLGAAFYYYLDAVCVGLGTGASLVETLVGYYDRSNAEDFTMRFNASSTWTRVYTQVWDEYDQTWVYGSSVEYVKMLAEVYGYRYSSTLNGTERYYNTIVNQNKYSSNYYNTTWRKQQAAETYSSWFSCVYDRTGAVSYGYTYANGYDYIFIEHSNNS